MLHVIQGHVTRDTRWDVFGGFGIKGPAEHDVACELVPDWVRSRKRNQGWVAGVPTAVCLWGGKNDTG